MTANLDSVDAALSGDLQHFPPYVTPGRDVMQEYVMYFVYSQMTVFLVSVTIKPCTKHTYPSPVGPERCKVVRRRDVNTTTAEHSSCVTSTMFNNLGSGRTEYTGRDCTPC